MTARRFAQPSPARNAAHQDPAASGRKSYAPKWTGRTSECPVRIGEVYVTGRQGLERNPYRERGRPCILFGALVDWNIGRARLFVNAENLGEVRQTRHEPLVRPVRPALGRWTVDAWAPIKAGR